MNQLFSEVKHWGEASYRFSTDHSQLDLFIEDEQSGIELLLEEDIGSGHLILEGKVDFITDRGIVLRVQGVTSEGEGVVYHQEHLGQFDGKLEIPLDSAYSHYVVNIQGLLHWSILDNEIVNGHWVETEVLVRVCDEVGDPYRFGFNGQEKVNEISGMGNHNTAEFWEYDTRLGRFMSVNPLSAQYPWNSPYAFAENKVINGIDLEGKEWENFMSKFKTPGELKMKLPNKKNCTKTTL